MSHESKLACDPATLKPFISLGTMALANDYRSPDATAPEREFLLEVGYSSQNHLAQLTVTVPPEDMFSDYLYFSSYARTVVDNAHELVRRLVADRSLGPDDLALEIASNDGYLLEEYVAAGVPVLGVDPAANVAAVANERGIKTVVEFFGADYGEQLRGEGVRASVIHANNVIAHVPDVKGVMRGMKSVLADDGVVVIETPYIRDLVEHLEFDTIYHEHIYYYSLSSIAGLLAEAGLEVVDVEHIPIHGGTIRVYSAHPGTVEISDAAKAMFAAEEAAGMQDFSYYEDFGNRVKKLLEAFDDLLTGLFDSGATVAAYGAAAKGTVMLNSVGDISKKLAWVADRNPAKQGLLMPGVGVPIVDPSKILEEQPDYLVILAWNFLPEIQKQEAEYLARGGKFVVPVPWPAIVAT